MGDKGTGMGDEARYRYGGMGTQHVTLWKQRNGDAALVYLA